MPRNEDYLSLYNDLEQDVLEIVTGSSSYYGGDFLLYKDDKTIGVAIETDEYLNIHHVYPSKQFNMSSRIGLPPNEPGNFLTLSSSTNFDLTDCNKRGIFLDMCLQFVSRENGNREKLLSDPHKWAKEKIEIMGNASSDKKPYPYIAELHLLQKLDEAGLVQDIEQEYRGPEKGVHDFEMAAFSLEVKSHLHGNQEDKPGEVTISSDKQLALNCGKPLYLVYCKVEDTGDLSLRSVIDSFGNKREIALKKLEKEKFYDGDLYWESQYHLLEEPLVYPVTGDFPRITPFQFVGGQKPSGVTKLIYDISLANLPCCTLSEFIEAKKQGREPEYRTN